MTSPPPFFFPYNQCRCLNLAFLFVLAPNRVEISTISILIPSKERLNFKRKLNLIKKTYFTIHWSSSVVVESVLKLVVSLRSQLSLIINLLIVHVCSMFCCVDSCFIFSLKVNSFRLLQIPLVLVQSCTS